MKKFLLKNFLLFFVAIFIPLALRYHYEAFNVFHWKNLRILESAVDGNENFVKTQYIIHNPQRFNAFILGSSRIGHLPQDALPSHLEEKNLNWFNMTYTEGFPQENYETLKSFLKNKIKIEAVLLGFDNISMYATSEKHQKELYRLPYQIYEKSKWEFYKPYFQTKIDFSIVKEVNNYSYSKHLENQKLFYDWGYPFKADLSLGNPSETDGHRNIKSFGYSQKDSYKDLVNILDLCKENNIKLFLFTTPLWEKTHLVSVKDGYLDFLRAVGQNCEFYNFSSLNNYTKNPAYYFESSHYRPALGLLIEKMIFGTEEERNQIRKDAGDELWGIKVNAENIDFVIQKLQEQISD